MGFGWEDIKKKVEEEIRGDQRATELFTLLYNGEKVYHTGSGSNYATYNTAYELAKRVGDDIARVLLKYAPEDLDEWDLNDLIPRALGYDMNEVTRACMEIQRKKNQALGLGIAPQEAEFNFDKAYGIVEELKNEKNFSEVYEKIRNQFENFSEAVVDDTIRANAETLWKAGVKTQVIRTADAKACKWCRSVQGAYDYSEAYEKGSDVWRRHVGCDCTIDFVSETSKGLYVSRINNQKRR